MFTPDGATLVINLKSQLLKTKVLGKNLMKIL